MSGPKHTPWTPGPWRVAGLDRDDENEPYEVLVAAESDPNLLVSVYTFTDDRGTALKDEVTWANAKLIAAAPRLAEALKQCADELEAELNDRYPADLRDQYESKRRHYEDEMQTVYDARAALREAGVDT